MKDIVITILIVFGLPFSLWYLLTTEKMTDKVEVEPKVLFEVGGSFEINKSASNETFVVDGRVGEKCFADASDLLIYHGGNGECKVIDLNGNFWFVGPMNQRTLLQPCPDKVTKSILDYQYYNEPSMAKPAARTFGKWTIEELEQNKCDSNLIERLRNEADEILMQ